MSTVQPSITPRPPPFWLEAGNVGPGSLPADGIAEVTHPEDVNLSLDVVRQAVGSGDVIHCHGHCPAAGQLEEDVRARLARDLHDGLGQVLTSLALFTKSIHDDAQGEPRRRLAALRVLVDEALAATRSLVWSLRPLELRGSRLVESLHRLAAIARERAGLRVDLQSVGLDAPLAIEVKTTIFLVVQEAMVNVMRHAGATTVSITVTRLESTLVAVVEDDGRGFDPVSPSRQEGMGLVSMAERAELAGGSLRVESAPGKGTVVRVELPCPVPHDRAPAVSP